MASPKCTSIRRQMRSGVLTAVISQKKAPRRPGGRNDFHAYLSENGYGHVLEPHGAAQRNVLHPAARPSSRGRPSSHHLGGGPRPSTFCRSGIASSPFFCGRVLSSPTRLSKRLCPGTSSIALPICSRRIARKAMSACSPIGITTRIVTNTVTRAMTKMLFRAMKAMYYACISFIDFNLGRILEALGDEIDNTLIVYTAGPRRAAWRLRQRRQALHAEPRCQRTADSESSRWRAGG